jgi:hypothetical protein
MVTFIGEQRPIPALNKVAQRRRCALPIRAG